MRRIRKSAAIPPRTGRVRRREKSERVKITVFDFEDSRLGERELASVEECFPYRDTPRVSWINMCDGLHDTSKPREARRPLRFHPSSSKISSPTHQRPKVEDHEHYLYIVLRDAGVPRGRGPGFGGSISIVLGATSSCPSRSAKAMCGPRPQRIRKGRAVLEKRGAITSPTGSSTPSSTTISSSREDRRRDRIAHRGSLRGTLPRDAPEDTRAQGRNDFPPQAHLADARGGRHARARRIGSNQKTTVVYLRDVYDHTVS